MLRVRKLTLLRDPQRIAADDVAEMLRRETKGHIDPPNSFCEEWAEFFNELGQCGAADNLITARNANAVDHAHGLLNIVDEWFKPFEGYEVPELLLRPQDYDLLARLKIALEEAMPALVSRSGKRPIWELCAVTVWNFIVPNLARMGHTDRSPSARTSVAVKLTVTVCQRLGFPTIKADALTKRLAKLKEPGSGR